MLMTWIVWGVWGVAVITWLLTQRTDSGSIGVFTVGILPWLATGMLLTVWTLAQRFVQS